MTNRNLIQEQLEEAIEEGDKNIIIKLVETINPNDLGETGSIKFLETLKRARLFPELEMSCKKAISRGNENPRVGKLLAQAQIDQGKLDEAIFNLIDLDQKYEWPVAEKSEIVGLLGRANKQKFVIKNNSKYLEKAINYYKDGWEHKIGDHRWHGINYVALLSRKDRDNSASENNLLVNAVSSEILSEISDLELDKKATAWDYGTAMEASIALNNAGDVFYWAKKYATHSDADAFALGGTIRQLREIWQIGSEGDTGKRLLPVLQYELLQRSGANLKVNQVVFHDGEGFEAVYGDEGPTRLQWFKTLLTKCRAIVKIVKSVDGAGVGSGFLIKASDLKKEWGDKPILITNAHVISDDDDRAFKPNQVQFQLTEIEGQPKYSIGNNLFYSDKSKLDVWISEIEMPEVSDLLGLSFYSPAVPMDEKNVERIYVAGHPGGGDFCVSMYDNDLIGFENHFVHYKSPTHKGSSGSPAMNQDLDAFAVHHRARNDISANEGILLSEILKSINNN